MSSPVHRRPRRGRLSRQDCHEAANYSLIYINERTVRPARTAAVTNCYKLSPFGTVRSFRC